MLRGSSLSLRWWTVKCLCTVGVHGTWPGMEQDRSHTTRVPAAPRRLRRASVARRPSGVRAVRKGRRARTRQFRRIVVIERQNRALGATGGRKPGGVKGPLQEIEMRSAPQAGSLALVAAAAACLAAHGASALDAATLEKLASGDASAKLTTVQEAVTSADVASLPVLRPLLEGRLAIAAGRTVVEEDGAWRDPLTQQPVRVPPGDAEQVS